MLKHLSGVLGFVALVALIGVNFQSVAKAQDQYRQNLVSSSVLETIKKRGKLIAGVSAFVPWVMRSTKGELIGFEIDVAKQVAEEMDVEIEFVPTQFDGIIPALLTGKFDMIMTGIWITLSWNMNSVNFSNPYDWTGLSLAAHKKLTAGFSHDDFNSSDVTITLRRGNAVGVNVAKKRWPKAIIRQFDDDQPALQDVLNGRAHAFLTAEPKPSNYVVSNPDVLYKPFGDDLLTKNPAGFALRKGDPDALNFLNSWIVLYTSSGWLKERHDYWFGTLDWQPMVAQK